MPCRVPHPSISILQRWPTGTVFSNECDRKVKQGPIVVINISEDGTLAGTSQAEIEREADNIINTPNHIRGKAPSRVIVVAEGPDGQFQLVYDTYDALQWGPAPGPAAIANQRPPPDARRQV